MNEEPNSVRMVDDAGLYLRAIAEPQRDLGFLTRDLPKGSVDCFTLEEKNAALALSRPRR